MNMSMTLAPHPSHPSSAPFPAPPDPVAVAERFRARIWSLRDEMEAERRLPPQLAAELAEAGMFRLLMPAMFGGVEADPLTALRVVEKLAGIDGSVGWLSLANMGALCTGFLDEYAAMTVLKSPNVIIGGALVPSGRARPVTNGYVVSGRWGYASGIQHSDWMMAGCRVEDHDETMRAVFLRTADIDIVDTWSVTGLRGTGSHDMVARVAFVPQDLSFAPGDLPVQQGPLYRFPIRSLGAAGIAAVCLGVAQSAIDSLDHLARRKTPAMTESLLRERSSVQVTMAQAVALVRSSRAWLFESIAEAWQQTINGDDISCEQQALLRLAATNACVNSAKAVDVVHAASGGAALFTSSPLERIFRDVHTATQHFSIQQSTYELVGRSLLGLSPLPGPPL
jgi:indole-3-acetate monooxygenase